MTPVQRRWAVLLATVATALLTARLGVWQLDRASQKNLVQDQLTLRMAMPPLDPSALARDAPSAVQQHQRRIELVGLWQTRHTVYLENRQMNGRPGFFAVTPLLLDDGSAVLVQRGWLPRDQADRTRIVVPPATAARVRLRGRIVPAPSALFEFTTRQEVGAIRQNLHIDDLARETGLKLRPLSVLQLGDAEPVATEGLPVPQPLASDGLLRQWPAPAANVDKHYGYAVQWFALSALSIGLYAWFQIIRPRRSRSA